MKIFITFLLLWTAGNLFNTAHACACCGLDNTWTEYPESMDDYMLSMMKSLKFISGEFSDAPAYEKNWDVDRVLFYPGKVVFTAGTSQLVFEFDKNIQHRAVDITFITNKNYKYSDEADIYHELILSGKLAIPGEILKTHSADTPEHALKKSVRAKMVLQGFGNACVEADSFYKWVLKLDDRDINFQASGNIVRN